MFFGHPFGPPKFRPKCSVLTEVRTSETVGFSSKRRCFCFGDVRLKGGEMLVFVRWMGFYVDVVVSYILYYFLSY